MSLAERTINDPATHTHTKSVLREFLTKDPVDAVKDAAMIHAPLKDRLEDQVVASPMTSGRTSRYGNRRADSSCNAPLGAKPLMARIEARLTPIHCRLQPLARPVTRPTDGLTRVFP